MHQDSRKGRGKLRNLPAFRFAIVYLCLSLRLAPFLCGDRRHWLALCLPAQPFLFVYIAVDVEVVIALLRKAADIVAVSAGIHPKAVNVGMPRAWNLGFRMSMAKFRHAAAVLQ